MATNAPNTRPNLYLPPELWNITLGNLRDLESSTDLTYLWTIARHFSTLFGKEVEKIFMEEHLPKTWLEFEYSKLRHPSPPGVIRLLPHFPSSV